MNCSVWVSSINPIDRNDIRRLMDTSQSIVKLASKSYALNCQNMHELSKALGRRTQVIHIHRNCVAIQKHVEWVIIQTKCCLLLGNASGFVGIFCAFIGKKRCFVVGAAVCVISALLHYTQAKLIGWERLSDYSLTVGNDETFLVRNDLTQRFYIPYGLFYSLYAMPSVLLYFCFRKK